MNESGNKNFETIKKWVAATNTRDPKQIAATLHPDYEYVFGRNLIKGKDKAEEEWKLFLEGIPDFFYEIQLMMESGDKVMAKLRMTGTQTGPFRFVGTDSLEKAIPPSNNKIDIEGCGVFVIKDEKILRLERYWDSATLLKQMGVDVKP